jgi:hypothetical protein
MIFYLYMPLQRPLIYRTDREDDQHFAGLGVNTPPAKAGGFIPAQAGRKRSAH